MRCTVCHFENPADGKYCSECGSRLDRSYGFFREQTRFSAIHRDGCGQDPAKRIGDGKRRFEGNGELKQVTVLFADLCDYSRMAERLDPEEVKEILNGLFGEITRIVATYDGFIEKFVGDAVMAVFGVTTACEDDPVRAIRAAREIHKRIESLSPSYEERIGQALSMHSGIETGLVVIGDIDLEKGTHGLSGKTINLASRVSGMAGPGDILVGPDTRRQAVGYFDFENLDRAKFKGISESVKVFRVVGPKKLPQRVHRAYGLRAKLTGRGAELARLRAAVKQLEGGTGSVLSIRGEAGAGKSRLLEELKVDLDLEKIQWQEGHAYPFAQKIPYFPLINLLSRAFQIEEGDSKEVVEKKFRNRMAILMGENTDAVKYIGGLFGISDPDTKEIGPDSWKFHLQQAVQEVFSTLARRAPTIICIEDLHWADPSSLELFQFILAEVRDPALVLYTYRPVANAPFLKLSEDFHAGHEIRLRDLTAMEMQDMLESLLTTPTIPSDLKRFVESMIDGNPFYLEEVVNSLIETETLVRGNGRWVLTAPIVTSMISPTIKGVIFSRLDRLRKEAKRALQEASVIGRTFLVDILYKISDVQRDLEACLADLEQADLIRLRSAHTGLEYEFKHALTQEVVYGGLLKKERRAIHEKIGLTIERLYEDRIAESYETLAFHFKRGLSVSKAVTYLVKSGQKSSGRYALEESHHYFQEALGLLNQQTAKTKTDLEVLIDLIIKWAAVFYYRGDFKGLTSLMTDHAIFVEELDDESIKGMFYAWFGFSVFWQGASLLDSHRYLSKAFQLGEKTGDQQLLGYASAFLAKTCAELGQIKEGARFEKQARTIANLFPSDAFLHMNQLSARGYIGWFLGHRAEVLDSGRALLQYGMDKPSIRCQMVGKMLMGVGHLMERDFQKAIECVQGVLHSSKDPYYAQYAQVLLGMFSIYIRDFDTAETLLEQVIAFCEQLDNAYLKTVAQLFLGIAQFAKGRMGQGNQTIETAQQGLLACHRNVFYGLSESLLGNIFYQLANPSHSSRPFSILIKNLGFLLKNFLIAGKKAETHLKIAIDVLEGAGAKGFLGNPYLRLGQLHLSKGRREQARDSILTSIAIFKECGQEVEIKEACNSLPPTG